MKIRKKSLPAGWYPDTELSLKNYIENIKDTYQPAKHNNPIACITPHAGWAFCGEFIVKTLLFIEANVSKLDSILILGGHMPANYPPIILDYDLLETPAGNITVDREITEMLKEKFNPQYESLLYSDNTIEVILPAIKVIFPSIKVAGIYPPANKTAFEIVEQINNIDKNVVVIGSSDLTHYGPNYYFTPAGVGNKGLKWAKNNDEKIIDMIINLKEELIFSEIEKNKNACSPGAIAGSMHFAKLNNKQKGILIEYGTSYDIYPSDSFVGYAAIVF